MNLRRQLRARKAAVGACLSYELSIPRVIRMSCLDHAVTTELD